MKNYSAIKQAGKLQGTIIAAKEKATTRATNRTYTDPLTIPLRFRLDAIRRIIPLGSATAQEVWAQVHKTHPHRKNWRSETAEKSAAAPYCREINLGRYSSRCTYTHYEYQPTVGCYGLASGSRLVFSYAGGKKMLPAPQGYRWTTDRNGIALVSLDGKKDYHPDSDDLRFYSPAAIRSKLLALYRQRQEQAKKEKDDLAAVRRAEREGAAICVADSVRAGNCKAGTVNFANRHGLNPASHYRPTELLKIANGDAHRVRLAVAVGLRRHRHEMSQGFCTLAEHKA